MTKQKYTPGPWIVTEPEEWPFDIKVVDKDGEELWSERRYAHSSRQRSVSDCMRAVGFDYDKREQISAILETQMADIKLRAAAPQMLEALILAQRMIETGLGNNADIAAVRAAIAKATKP